MLVLLTTCYLLLTTYLELLLRQPPRLPLLLHLGAQHLHPLSVAHLLALPSTALARTWLGLGLGLGLGGG